MKTDYENQKKHLFEYFSDIETKEILKEMNYFKDGFINIYETSNYHMLSEYSEFNKKRIVKEVLSTREHVMSKKQRKVKRREMATKGN